MPRHISSSETDCPSPAVPPVDGSAAPTPRGPSAAAFFRQHLRAGVVMLIGLPVRLHRDEQGVISMLSLCVIFGFTMLLGMLINVGRSVDSKIRLQNTADAATYTGGVVIARGMNAVAFSNHLLSEVFALTAYMREGRDRNAETFVPKILEAWQKMGEVFSQSTFQKFARLGRATGPKVGIEQRLVKAFGDLTELKSQMTLPALESILGQPGNPQSQVIPEFQRTVVQAIPEAAQLAMTEIARRHLGTANNSRRANGSVLWRVGESNVGPVGDSGETSPLMRTLPIVDPSPQGNDAQQWGGAQQLQAAARQQRDELARMYLDQWIRDNSFDLGPFEREAFSQGGKVSGKMSQFINLWRLYTHAQLQRLLNQEFPQSNLPHVYRPCQNCPSGGGIDLDGDHGFVGVAYSGGGDPFFPGLFQNRQGGEPSDRMAFAQVQVFLPLPRFRTSNACGPWMCPSYDWYGNQSCNLCTDNWPTTWNLYSQNWTVKLMPVRTPQLQTILQRPPGQYAPGNRPPSLSGLTPNDLRVLNTH